MIFSLSERIAKGREGNLEKESDGGDGANIADESPKVRRGTDRGRSISRVICMHETRFDPDDLHRLVCINVVEISNSGGILGFREV